jgi:hypothetical protein
MLILTAENKVLDTRTMKVGDEVHHGVLSFQDHQNPDFYFNVVEFLEEFSSASITLRIGEYEVVMPLHWSILCTDLEYLQSIPLWEVGGKHFPVFCLNPIDGYQPEFLRLRTSTIFPQNTWTAPQLNDKDLLVVPLGAHHDPMEPTVIEDAIDDHSSLFIDQKRKRGDKGPLCAFFSASKFEVYKPVGDVWGD